PYQCLRVVISSETRPRNLVDDLLVGETKQASLLMGHPQLLASVRHEPMDGSTGHAGNRNEAIMVDVTQPLDGEDPQSSAMVPTDRFDAARQRLPHRDASLAPSFDAVGRSEPHASIGVRQHASRTPRRHALFRGKGYDGQIAKAVETAEGHGPDA